MTTSYTYDNEDILREVRGGTTLKYVHGPDVDEPLAREDGSGALTYYHLDGLGSIAKRTNQAGAAAHEYRYDAWGNIETGASEPGYAFTSREWDPETGFYYYRARYNDPRIGRFLSQDPIGFLGNDVNLYAYVWNDPVNWSDPSGLKGRRRTARSVAIKKLQDLMKDPDTQRNEQCFSVCQEKGKDPFATRTTYGTADDCPITFCPTGSTVRAFCHVHPWVGGYPGHSPRETGGGDFYWPDKEGVPSYVGQGGNIWEYDPTTQKEKKVCCEK